MWSLTALPRLRVAATAAVALCALLVPVTAATAAPSPAPPGDTTKSAAPHVDRFRKEAARKPLPDTVAKALTAGSPVVCEGDGTSGKRTEVLYVREPSQTYRFVSWKPTFRAWASQVDAVFNDSAAETGASRHVRYVTEPDGAGCRVAVRYVEVPEDALDTWESGNAALQALGYNRTDRSYVVLTESGAMCGRGDAVVDDQPGAANAHNTGPRYARVDAGCWGNNAIAHELAHSFGAVQFSAPHTDNGWHCTEEWDLMCYGGTPTFRCLDKGGDRLLDCNHDDYFHTNPAPGSYLATHWNVANNDFLIKASTPDTDDHPHTGWTYSITAASNGEAIDLTGSAGQLAELSTRAPSGSTAQQWIIGYVTGDQLVNKKTRMCADAAYSGTSPGTHVLQYNCADQNGMKWAFLPLANGKYSIINTLSGLALQQNGAWPASLTLQTYTGATNQQWTFTRLTDAPPAGGAKYYLTSTKSLENVDVLGASTAVGAAITHTAQSGATSQRWTFYDVGTDWYLINDNSGWGLELAANNSTPGTGTRQWNLVFDGTHSQKWKLVRTADSTYAVVNTISGLVLTQSGGANSTLTQEVYNGYNGLGQDWALSPAP